MALMDDLNRELAACENELRKCDEIIMKQQERRECYAEKKTMLEGFIKSATLEQEKANKAKPAEKRESSRKNKTKSNEETSSDESTENADNDPVEMSVKDLAESLNVSQSTIANMTNKLGLTLKMVDSKYMLTAEQIDLIKKEINA